MAAFCTSLPMVITGFSPSLKGASPVAGQECLTTSDTTVLIRWELLLPSTSTTSDGRSSSATRLEAKWHPQYHGLCRPGHRPACRSGLLRVAGVFHPSPRISLLDLEWVTMPCRTSQVRFNPFPPFSRWSTTRRLWRLCRKPGGYSRSNTSSPMCPKGEWPRSCPRAMASTRSSFRFSARAIVRPIWATSSVCVNLVT